MLLASFAHRALLALGLFIILVACFLAVEVGLLGEDAQAQFRSLWVPLIAFYEAHKTAVDIAGAVLGAVASAVTAAFAIYKSWYYAEFNLPDRLREFIEPY
jgi:hypothetical protein